MDYEKRALKFLSSGFGLLMGDVATIPQCLDCPTEIPAYQ